MSAGNGSERFCNERSDGCTSIRGGELDKKVPQAYRAYVEKTFLSHDAGDARIFVNVELDTETGLYYGARHRKCYCNTGKCGIAKGNLENFSFLRFSLRLYFPPNG